MNSNARTDCILIRDATSADCHVIRSIESDASTLFPADRLPQPDLPLRESTLVKGIGDDLLWVSTTTDDTVTGFALASCHGKHLHLEELDVHPDFMRRGIGSALVEHVVDVARQKNYLAVTLTTFADLSFNAPFYARLGFSSVTPETTHSLLDSILVKESLMGLTNRIGMIKQIAPGKAR